MADKYHIFPCTASVPDDSEIAALVLTYPWDCLFSKKLDGTCGWLSTKDSESSERATIEAAVGHASYNTWEAFRDDQGWNDDWIELP